MPSKPVLTDQRLAELIRWAEYAPDPDQPSEHACGSMHIAHEIASALTRLRVLERAIGDSRHWWHDQHDAVAISVTLGGGAVPRGATLNDAIAAASKEVQP